ncbi:discoidin domain-containing protein [Paenibacillus germinis]|nr:discoidin domain-containing protein [Paenibacillus germinis]
MKKISKTLIAVFVSIAMVFGALGTSFAPKASADSLAAVNVALNKPATASEGSDLVYPNLGPDKAFNGVVSRFDGWSADSGVWADKPKVKPWLQVDLQGAYVISSLEVVARPGLDDNGNAWYNGERKTFQILGSNDPTFADGTYAVLGEVGTTAFTGDSKVFTVTNTNAYRYIRYVKTSIDYAFLSELRVFGTPENANALKFKFCLASDTHIPTGSANLTTELQISVSQDCKAFVITGDLTEGSTDAQYDALMSIMNSTAHPPAYYVIGNHDVRATAGTFAQLEARFKQKTGMPAMYSDAWIEDHHFIFLGTEQNEGSDEVFLSDNQLSWLETKLAENADYDKPIFVFIHQPLQETVNGTYIANGYGLKGWRDGVRQWTKVKSILAKYPQVIFTSGHMHSSAGMFRAESTFVNAGSTTPSGGSPQQMLVFEVYGNRTEVKAVHVTDEAVTWTGAVPALLTNTSLQQDVTEANALLNGSSIGSGTNQYPTWAAEYLGQAIDDLEALLAAPNATKSQFGNAMMALRNAKTVFEKSKNAVTNIALHKPSTSSDGAGYDQVYPPSQAFDGGVQFTNGWNRKTTASTWIQVDLQAESLINRVEIDARPTSTFDGERKNFEIQASNDPTFATYTVLGSVGSTAFTTATWGLDLTTTNTYRYVRYQKTGSEYVFLTEMRVFGIAKGKYPISGKVVNASGSPVSGVTVKLYAYGSTTVLGTATTGTDGKYTLTASQLSGKYTVTAEKTQYQTGNQTVTIPYAAVTDADFTLSP